MPDQVSSSSTTMPPGLTEPDLSIVIVSYNTVGLLVRCLRSALADAPLGTEVYVVDNASSDGSAHVVCGSFPTVRLIANKRNVGFAAAVNQALRFARGRYITLLNPDAELRGGSLPGLLRFLDARPDVGVAGARMSYADGRFQHSAFRFPSLMMAWLEFFPINHRITNSRFNGRFPPRDYNHVFSIDHPLGACMTVRRGALDDVGLLDETFFLYCEEVDWCWRFKEAGWDVVHCPDAMVIHGEAQSTRQCREETLVHLYRSRYRLYAKHRAGWQQQMQRCLVRIGVISKLAPLLLYRIGARTLEKRRLAQAELTAYFNVLRL